MLTCNVINGLQNRTDRNRTHWTDRGVFYKSPPVRACAFQNFVETGSHLSNLSCPVFVSFCDRLTHFPQHAPRNTLDTLPANLFRAIERHHARIALHHAGGLSWARYAPSRGLPAMRTCMYRRRCPGASWVDLGRLSGIGARDLHVDSAMPCSYLVAWCDAYARPACRWIPAWIPANHRRLAAYHV